MLGCGTAARVIPKGFPMAATAPPAPWTVSKCLQVWLARRPPIGTRGARWAIAGRALRVGLRKVLEKDLERSLMGGGDRGGLNSSRQGGRTSDLLARTALRGPWVLPAREPELGHNARPQRGQARPGQGTVWRTCLFFPPLLGPRAGLGGPWSLLHVPREEAPGLPCSSLCRNKWTLQA